MKKKNRKVSVGVTRTINTGNYESLKIYAGVSFDISDKADIDDAYDDAYDEVAGQLIKCEEKIIQGEVK